MSQQNPRKELVFPKTEFDLAHRQDCQPQCRKSRVAFLVVDAVDVEESFCSVFSGLSEAVKLIIAEFWVPVEDRVFEIRREQFDVSSSDGNIPCVIILFLEGERGSCRSAFKELRVVAHLPQLHHQVHQVLDLGLRLKHFEQLFYVQLVLYRLIQQLLSLCHLAQDLMLVFLAYFVLHILLDPS